MKKIIAVFAVALVTLAFAHPAEAQKPGKVYRIGFLSPSSRSTRPLLRAFLEGLRDLGWIERQNIAIEGRWTAGKHERFPAFAAELIRLKVDVFLTISTTAARAAVNATTTIPIVFTFVASPVEMGFVASLARPGGNVTGLTSVSGPEIFGKQLELLKEVVPHASRVAVLYNPVNPYTRGALRKVKVVARSLRVQLQVLEARRPDDFDAAFAAMARKRAEALLVLAGGMFVLHRGRLAELSTKSRLPTMHGLRPNAEAGGLMAFATSSTDIFRRAAGYVDRILRGAKPADLPVERPTKYELIINLKTAKKIGLTIPPDVLVRATKVIK